MSNLFAEARAQRREGERGGNYLPQRHRERGVSGFFKIFGIPELRVLCVSVVK
jgi:hypothetical protein